MRGRMGCDSFEVFGMDFEYPGHCGRHGFRGHGPHGPHGGRHGPHGGGHGHKHCHGPQKCHDRPEENTCGRRPFGLNDARFGHVHFGPHRGHFGHHRGHFDHHHGHFGPHRGHFGPHHGHFGPYHGHFRPHPGFGPFFGNWTNEKCCCGDECRKKNKDKQKNQPCDAGKDQNEPNETVLIQRIVVDKSPRCYSV